MSLSQQIYARTQRPTYRVRVANIELTKVESVMIEHDFDQATATCTITCARKWGIEPNDVVEVWQGYGGLNLKTFTGYVDDVDKETFPKHMVIRCRDALKWAIENFIIDEIEYDSKQAEEIVADLLERCGIYNYTLDTTNFTVGDVEPAKFSLIFAMDAIRSVADLIGWRCWATPDGTVVFKKVYPRGALQYRWHYTKDPTFGSESGIIHINHVSSDIDLRNWIEVWGWTNPSTGSTIEATASADSPYVPDPPRYKKALVSNELIDTQAMAQWVADRVLSDLNQLVDRMNATIQGNPNLHIGDTVRITEDWTDMASGVNYFIYGISAEERAGGAYQMTLDLRGGRYSVPPWTEGQPPIASFEVKQVGWGDPHWIVYVDASASHDPDGVIVSYDFDWGDGSAHGAQVRDNHYYSSGSLGDPFTITLVVTDDDGLTGTCSKDIILGSSGSGSGVYDRVLYFADGSGLAFGSPDSGNTWNSFSCGAAVSQVAANSADKEPYAWFGAQNGRLYKSVDYCVSGTLIYTFGSAITALWVNRVDPNVLVVGLSDGKIYKTVDDGSTWLLIGEFEGPVYWVITRYGDPNHILAAGGTSTGWLRLTIDGGTSWTEYASGWAVESIRDGCTHFLTHLGFACRTDPSPVRHTDDNLATFSSPSGISDQNLSTITAEQKFDDQLKIAGGAGGLAAWITTDGLTYATSGSLISGTEVLKVLIDQELYGTVFGGTKDAGADLEISFDYGATWKQLYDSPGDVNDIAQGPLLERIEAEEVVLIATSADGIYRTDLWTAAVPTWALKNNGLTDLNCLDLIRDPFYTSGSGGFRTRYWLLTTDGLYRTDDSGETWVKNLTIPQPEAGGRTPQYVAICYGASEGTLYVSYFADGGFGSNRTYLLKTIDGGINWVSLHIPGEGLWPDSAWCERRSLCVSLEDDNLVYLTGGTVNRIRAWRVHWDIPQIIEIRNIFAGNRFTVHSPRNHDDWVWLHGSWGSYEQIERSIDKGLTWVDADADQWDTLRVETLLSHYMNYTDVICTESLTDKIYESIPGLGPWTELCDLGAFIWGVICVISRNPTDIDYIIIGASGGEAPPGKNSKIMVTEDRGQTWQDKTGNIPYDCGSVNAIAGPWDEDTVSGCP